MYDAIELMLPAFLVCLVLTGMHAYLGLHILARGVIFVDLALAQIAALGATVGYLFGFGLHSEGSYLCSLSFALIGAAIFTLSRSQSKRVPQEAMIGLVYAISAAALVLVLSRSPEGGEELKSLLVGHLLFVSWKEILYVLVLYSAVGLIHYFARKRFMQLSFDPENPIETGTNTALYDLLFYGTFALVVTSSVELGGVLLVFSFLIAPAICARLLCANFRSSLAVAWGVGTAVSALGIILSYLLDLPSGAAVVCSFAPAVILAMLVSSGRGGGVIGAQIR